MEEKNSDWNFNWKCELISLFSFSFTWNKIAKTNNINYWTKNVKIDRKTNKEGKMQSACYWNKVKLNRNK